MKTREITVLATEVKEAQQIARRAELVGLDGIWSGELPHRSALAKAAEAGAVCERSAWEPPLQLLSSVASHLSSGPERKR